MNLDLEGLFITFNDRSLKSRELLPLARVGITNFKVLIGVESDDSFKLNVTLDSLSVKDIRKSCEWLATTDRNGPSFFPDCVESSVVAQVVKDGEGHMMVEATLETLKVVLVVDFLASLEHFFRIPIVGVLERNQKLLDSLRKKIPSCSFLTFQKVQPNRNL